MRVAYDETSLENFLKLAAKVSRDHPVVISKFIEGAKEVEADGVSDGETCLIGAVIEHVENAGVHSGDATMTIPPQTLSPDVTQESGRRHPQNRQSPPNQRSLQHPVPRQRRRSQRHRMQPPRLPQSMPFVSKTRGVNLIELATLAMLDKKFSVALKTCELPPIHHVGVKVPQFSFMRLSGADPVLGRGNAQHGRSCVLGRELRGCLLEGAAVSRVPHAPQRRLSAYHSRRRRT